MIKITKLAYMPGYTSSMEHPFLFVSISIDKNKQKKDNIIKFDEIMYKLLSTYPIGSFQEYDEKSVAYRIAIVIDLFYESQKFRLLSKIKIKKNLNNIYYHIPILESNIGAARKLITWIVSVLNGNRNELENSFTQLAKLCQISMPKGVNPYRILRIATENNIPWRTINRDIFQLGWGSRACLFNSTITDKTPFLSVEFSQNKLITKKLLESIGLPVATGFLVNSEDEAVSISNKLGYPVVVKPIDRDGGVGVNAGLSSQKYMLKAYEKACKLSSKVMIEKHFEGNDHRLHVIHNEVYYASHRIPPTITGSGKHTIKDLIYLLNNEREKIKDSNSNNVTPISIKEDEALMEILEEKNLKLDSVLKKGEIVNLRRIPNVSTGGTSITIEDLSTIHKDNIELAKRAVNVLRLDIAAVDLLIPDITKSWMEVGAIITEVNAKPQIGDAKRLQVALKKLVIKNGRIPCIFVFGDIDIEFNSNIVRKTKKINFNIGISDHNILYKNNQLVTNIDISNVYQSGIRLTSDPSIDAMIIYIEDLSLLSTGLPVDSFDMLVFLKNPKNIDKNSEVLNYIIKIADQVILNKQMKIGSRLYEKALILEKEEIEDTIVKLFTVE